MTEPAKPLSDVIDDLSQVSEERVEFLRRQVGDLTAALDGKDARIKELEARNAIFTESECALSDAYLRLRANAALHAALFHAGQAIHSEYCGRECHEECRKVEAALANAQKDS